MSNPARAAGERSRGCSVSGGFGGRFVGHQELVVDRRRDVLHELAGVRRRRQLLAGDGVLDDRPDLGTARCPEPGHDRCQLWRPRRLGNDRAHGRRTLVGGEGRRNSAQRACACPRRCRRCRALRFARRRRPRAPRRRAVPCCPNDGRSWSCGSRPARRRLPRSCARSRTRRARPAWRRAPWTGSRLSDRRAVVVTLTPSHLSLQLCVALVLDICHPQPNATHRCSKGCDTVIDLAIHRPLGTWRRLFYTGPSTDVLYETTPGVAGSTTVRPSPRAARRLSTHRSSGCGSCSANHSGGSSSPPRCTTFGSTTASSKAAASPGATARSNLSSRFAVVDPGREFDLDRHRAPAPGPCTATSSPRRTTTRHGSSARSRWPAPSSSCSSAAPSSTPHSTPGSPPSLPPRNPERP